MPARPGGPGDPGSFATALRLEREAAGLTQAELARRAGVGERTVSNLERGINRAPYPSTARLLAEALGLSSSARSHLLDAARGALTPSSPEPTSRPLGGFLGARPNARLVARADQTALVSRALADVAEREGRMLVFSGEAGIGKTRLAQESVRLAEEQGFLVAVGRCYQTQGDTPFVPFFDAFAGLYDAASYAVRRATAERWPALAALLPAEAPRTLDRGSRRLTPVEEMELLRRAATGFVRELASEAPVAIFVDDLHWADDASLELLAHLARHLRDERVLLLGTLRPGDSARSPRLRVLTAALRREELVEAIELTRLDVAQTEGLVADRLGSEEVSRGLVEMIHGLADGNPFFTLEPLAALIERGDLSRVDGRWTAREVGDVAAPVGVSEVIHDRVSRLTADAHLVLETASVLGEVFPFEDLAITGLDESALERVLDEVVASGLVAPRGEGYAFDHVLTHRALYASLSPARRRRTHRDAGAELERRPDHVLRRRAAEIARHLERGGSRDRAVRFWILAGTVASELHTHEDAVRHYRRAIDLAAEVDDQTGQARSRERLGELLITVARYDEAIDQLERASTGYEQAADRGGHLRAEGQIANALYRKGFGDDAAERLARVLDVAVSGPGTTGSEHVEAVLLCSLSRVRLAVGQYDLSVESSRRASALAAAGGWSDVEADAETVRGTVLIYLDRPEEAVSVLEGAVALASRAASPSTYSGALMSLAWTSLMQGRVDRGSELIDHGLQANRSSGDTDAESLNLAGLGLNRFYAGEWAEAETHLLRGMELARAASPTLFSGIVPAYLGVLRQGQGDLAAAEAAYAEAARAPDLDTFGIGGYLDARRAQLDLLQSRPEAAWARIQPWLAAEKPTRLHDVMLLATAAEACLALDDLDGAESLAERSLARAAATHNGLDVADGHRVRARVHARRGNRESARACLEEGLAVAVQAPYALGEGRILLELARLGFADGDDAVARGFLDTSVAIFARLGAACDLASARSVAQGRADGPSVTDAEG